MVNHVIRFALMQIIIGTVASGSGAGEYQPRNLLSVGDTLFFQGYHPDSGVELWKSDGTDEGTTIVEDLNPGSDGSDPEELYAINGLLYFESSDPDNYTHIWKSDGTSSNTVRLYDVPAPIEESAMGSNGMLNGNIILSGNNWELGKELWMISSESSVPQLIKDINPGEASSNPWWGIVHNNVLYFSAITIDHDRQLWKSDGTSQGTVMVKDLTRFYGGSSFYGFMEFEDQVYFLANGELWKTDGTESGTVPFFYVDQSSMLAKRDGWMYFQSSRVDGLKLYKTKGTAETTFVVKNFHIDDYGGSISRLTATPELVFFAASSGFQGPIELWRSDGTEAGTFAVTNLASYGDNGPLDMVFSNGKLFFRYNTAAGSELWVSDGTQLGTFPVKNLGMQSFLYGGWEMQPLGNGVIFASDTEAGRELWRSDGSAVGTYKISDPTAPSRILDYRSY